MRRCGIALLTASALAGCTVGPDYARPRVAGVDAPWIASVAPGEVASRWWTALADPVLDRLIADAIAHNLDVREAEARLREARANVAAARGRTLPEIDATGSAAYQQLSGNGQLPVDAIPFFDRRFRLFDVGLDASWELDLWGAGRRSVEAARARAGAAGERIEDVRLRVVAEVVRDYADLREAQARGSLLDEEARLRREIADLMDLRFRAGESSRGDASEDRRRADAAAAGVPGARADAQAAAYALALLTGRPPEALAGLAVDPAALPTAPSIVAAGVRSELLRRRPDVRAAEADLAAATADVGVETAGLYPSFSLTGEFGRQGRSVGSLGSGASTRFSIGPSFRWPIFSFGRIRAQIRAANARTDAAAAAYERAVLSALSDSETAANRYAAALVSAGRSDDAAVDAEDSARLAGQRFARGEDDRTQMLEARSTSLSASRDAIAARAASLRYFAAFAKALGGGVR